MTDERRSIGDLLRQFTLWNIFGQVDCFLSVVEMRARGAQKIAKN